MSNYESTTAYLQSLADRGMSEARNNAGRLYSLPPNISLREPKFAGVNLQKPNIGPPPTFGDLFQGGDNTDSTIIYLNEQSDKFMQQYFPAISGDMRTIPDDMLCEIISGVRPFGLPNTVFELVWHNARDRAYRTTASEGKQIAAEFSGRGWQIPPGAMVDAITQSEQRASDALLELNVQQAIKDEEVKLQMLQFALQLAADYKRGIMASLADFYRAWITVPDKDIERARIKAQAMSALYSALSTYYNVEINFEELRLRAGQTGAEVDLGVDRNRLSLQGNASMAASGLSSGISSFARVAEAAAAGAGSLTAEIASV